MEIKDLYQIYSKFYLVDTDTRKIRENSLFFALKGEHFDGNQFVHEALKKGAAFCIIDNPDYSVVGKTILVNDVLETLQALAKYHRKQLKIPVIGLTGSNGKTTTKELLFAVLSQKYRTLATQGNLNNHIGVPLTILSITLDIELAIIEMGANHQKEIEFLSSISLPDYGYITNFGKAHLEGFGGIEGVIKGKSELYENIRKHRKKVFVNVSDRKQMELTQDLDRILFNPEDIKIHSESPLLTVIYKDHMVNTQLIGTYNKQNIAAAFCVGEYFDVNIEKIRKAITDYTPTNNRSQKIQKGSNIIFLDAYNANPSSVSEALMSFSRIKETNHILILGDMLELGVDSLKEHQSINQLISKLDFKTVFLVGEQYSEIETNYCQFSTFNKLADYLTKHPINNSQILIKGSRKLALERVLDYI